MGALCVYILKSGISLSFLYLFYRLLLSKETFHRFNRIALLGGVLLSILLPLLPYTAILFSSPVQEGRDLFTFSLQEEFSTFPVEITQSQSIDPIPVLVSLLFLVYFTGVFWFSLQTGWGFSRLNRILKTSSFYRKEEGIIINITREDISAFSWMNRIVISQTDWLTDGEEIRMHETGHIRNNHSRDLLFIQVCVIFHWFNPAVWLLKRELQNIHEFEADAYTLERVNARQYQLLLIKKSDWITPLYVYDK